MRKCLLCAFGFFLAICVTGVGIFCIIYFLGPQPGLVETPSGTIRGLVVTAPDGRQVEEFLGIPFAEKPIGSLRYKDPVPLDKLPSDPYEATDYQYSCMQYLDTTYGDFRGSAMWNPPNPVSEDCLYLNVWVPKMRNRIKKLPVMVWIYGGGFFAGSNALWVYDGKALSTYGDVVVVSFNYRVGTFGFLSTGDNRIKGNFGMKDQVVALQWIQKNIESFGGDPDLVTIFGESSGASSAGLHMMSEQSQDLFKRAIFESGSPDSQWSFMTSLQAQERSSKFLSAVGCQQQDSEELLDCLRKLDANFIMENEWVDLRFMVFPWAPTIDGDFLTDTPFNLLHTKRIPKKETLLGVNKDEGTFWLLYALPGFTKDGPSLHNYTMFLDGVDQIDFDLNAQTRESIKTLYSAQNLQDLEANRDNLDKVVGDRSFTCPTKELARIYSSAGLDTYFYYLTYRASTEVWPPWMGVIHGAEIQWVFGMPTNKTRGYTEAEISFAKSVMSYWTNFARYGDPNGPGLSEWPQYLRDSPKYMEFRGPEDFIVSSQLRDKYCSFWMDVNNKTNMNIPV